MHQLNFYVTVRCGNKDALLRLERMLKIKAVASLTLGHPLFKYVDDFAKGDVLGGFEVEIDSIDINWDDEDEEIVPSDAEDWVPLSCIAPGSLFETQDGVRAVRCAYPSTGGYVGCMLLGSGEARILSVSRMVKRIQVFEDGIPF